MYHVKELTTVPAGGLDLNIADEDEFSPDKLRANIERFYMTIVSGLMTSLGRVLTLLGHRHDGVRQAHRSITVMARDTTNCLVLLSILYGMDL